MSLIIYNLILLLINNMRSLFIHAKEETTTIRGWSRPSSSTTRGSSSTQLYNINEFPTFDMGDKVEFYFIESSFPFTTSLYIRNNMGDLWNQYSLTHAGLGIWNKDTNIKYSIEIVCMNYTCKFVVVSDE